ncbi:MAG: AsmA-like C-terminal region-containing protein, partial [Porticoccaceae bacterium]
RLEDINSEITFDDEMTRVQFTSQLADGLVSLPADEYAVPRAEFSRLTLPSALLQEKIGQEAVDPRTFVAADISIDRLSVGDVQWGALAFELRPEVSGAAVNNIRGNLFGIQPGHFADEPATEFFWSFDGSNHGSRLVGPIGIGNIGDIFTAFDIAKVVDSSSGKMTVNLAWDDKPWNISRENLRGDFQLRLEDGSFYKSPGGADAALKLISLFNFANWLRRLQLDFSDVVGQNLAYNNLSGNIRFEDGVAKLADPLKMRMPSGRMSIAGDFDLTRETVDAQLVATLPVATNLPWVVALMGGLPAAAGVYVTSKLVEKQVDRLSSISYKVSGPWDDVEVAVDKIFAAELKNVQEDESSEAVPSGAEGQDSQ